MAGGNAKAICFAAFPERLVFTRPYQSKAPTAITIHNHIWSLFLSVTRSRYNSKSQSLLFFTPYYSKSHSIYSKNWMFR